DVYPRMTCVRPLYFHVSDSHCMIDSNWALLLEWDRRRRLLQAHCEYQPADFRGCADELYREGVSYWLTRDRFNSHDWKSAAVWNNGVFYLVKLGSKA
ncbi:MAG TPA: hypothetical protein VMU17_06975, partial [Elusimicrobiota bacterium]|nr:hypothetical protein [Elusimicrobiota bacterium]